MRVSRLAAASLAGFAIAGAFLPVAVAADVPAGSVASSAAAVASGASVQT